MASKPKRFSLLLLLIQFTAIGGRCGPGFWAVPWSLDFWQRLLYQFSSRSGSIGNGGPPS